MKVYTTYFGNLRNLDLNIVPISICAITPNFFKGIVYSDVAPTKSILKQYKLFKNKKVYTERYENEVLNNIDIHKFYEDLSILSEGKDVALVCYEKAGDFCHRRLLAKRMEEELGIIVDEY